MSATIPIPIWAVLAFIVLGVVWHAAMALQTREMRRLFEWYLEARPREPEDPAVTPAPVEEP